MPPKAPNGENEPPPSTLLRLSQGEVPVCFRRNERARRYILSIRPNGQVWMTIPRRGTQSEAVGFLRQRAHWIERVLARQKARPTIPEEWTSGTKVLFRGEFHELTVLREGESARVQFAADSAPLIPGESDLRAAVEGRMRQLAAKELPARTWELANHHQCPVRRVSIRDQKSRWGSCSRRGLISLNWRLIQMPPDVRDYIIVHELMHLREMNHSKRYWAQVAQAFPDYMKCEAWLKTHSHLVRKAS